MNKFFGIALIVMALAIATIPMFTDCQSQGKAISLANGKTVPMKCHWTGVAELATGAPLLVVGAMMVATRRKESQILLGVTGSVLGVVAILLPTALIGTCQSDMMLCHSVMKPSLVSLGSLAVAGSLGAMVLAIRKPSGL